jgi:UDP-N-acetylmuramoyl-tripeptide--D-alanyl-D-alanine ligase
MDHLYNAFLEHPVISTDSRRITPGCIFFALKGDQFNGNQYAARAIEQGAALAVVDEPVLLPSEKHILVKDVLTALQELARHHRLKLNIPVVAITGTNGKTTTKELALAVLSKQFSTMATRGNLNNHIGVPLTLLSITPETEIAIVEMGANHPGEIAFLCNIALPTHGLITNIGKAHLEGFGGFEGVIRTKTELYQFLRQTKGKVFIHKDNPLLMEHAGSLSLITYGNPPASLAALTSKADPFVDLEISFGETTPRPVHSRLYGSYNTPNLLAAAAIGHHFGVNPSMICEALEQYEPVNSRSQIIRTANNLLVMDAYNANPSSMEAALVAFAGASYPSKMLILGDMLELGDQSDQEHLRVLRLAEELGFAAVYLVGPTFTRLNTKKEYHCFNDSDLARMWFEHHPPADTAILIKGSRGIRLEKVEKAIS